jgi:hypothetical protein
MRILTLAAAKELKKPKFYHKKGGWLAQHNFNITLNQTQIANPYQDVLELTCSYKVVSLGGY